MILHDDYLSEDPNPVPTKEILDEFFKIWNSNNRPLVPRTHYIELPVVPAVKVISADEILEDFNDTTRLS